MTAVALTYFTDFKLQIWNGVHNFNSDTFKFLLTNGAPSAAWTAISSATEISREHGYDATGGIALTVTATSSGVAVTDYTLTAGGGTIGPFRYGILYNSSVGASNNLVLWADYGSALTMLNTQTCLFDFPSVLLPATWSP